MKLPDLTAQAIVEILGAASDEPFDVYFGIYKPRPGVKQEEIAPRFCVISACASEEYLGLTHYFGGLTEFTRVTPPIRTRILAYGEHEGMKQSWARDALGYTRPRATQTEWHDPVSAAELHTAARAVLSVVRQHLGCSRISGMDLG